MFNVNKISVSANDEISIKGQMVMSDYITSPIFNDSLTAYVNSDFPVNLCSSLGTRKSPSCC